jgi:hypothetical protein
VRFVAQWSLVLTSQRSWWRGTAGWLADPTRTCSGASTRHSFSSRTLWWCRSAAATCFNSRHRRHLDSCPLPLSAPPQPLMRLVPAPLPFRASRRVCGRASHLQPVRHRWQAWVLRWWRSPGAICPSWICLRCPLAQPPQWHTPSCRRLWYVGASCVRFVLRESSCVTVSSAVGLRRRRGAHAVPLEGHTGLRASHRPSTGLHQRRH